MPKFKNGCLIKCEKSIRIYLQSLDRAKEIIVQELDENHLIIKESEVKYVKEKLAELQNDNYNDREN